MEFQLDLFRLLEKEYKNMALLEQHKLFENFYLYSSAKIIIPNDGSQQEIIKFQNDLKRISFFRNCLDYIKHNYELDETYHLKRTRF